MDAFVANDNTVRLTGARTTRLDTGEDVYLDAGATVTFRVQSMSYVDVTGETWPVTMSYIAGSQGDFIGVLRDTVVLDAGLEYRFVGQVDNGVDQHGSWDIPLHARNRES